jgi:membrane protein YqaA with SNARE-associated domain
MRIFGLFYDKALQWAKHSHAPRYLVGLTFAESSFFPVPPDVMLAPMVLARRDRAWYLASLTTGASVLGGVFGYLIGLYLYSYVGERVVEFYHAEEALAKIEIWFDTHGVWIILLAGFTPIPYKLFTISAGILSMALIPFVICSLIGRGARFFLVAGLIFWAGASFERVLRKYFDWICWIFLAVLAILFLIFHGG